MNERIRALAEAAGAKYFKDVAVVADRGASGNATDFIPKFAELIVRECMDNLAWHGEDEAVSKLEWFKVNKLGIK